jgi:hydroxyacylglutathione hydrolase
MQITDRIHALRIPFKIPIGPEKMIERIVYSYIVFGTEITLIDTGVTGAETVIFDYLKMHGREPAEISLVVLTHSHPDHIGAIKAIRETTGCRIAAHLGEKEWIEDTEKQFRERPVPGFHALVGGPVAVDQLLYEGEAVDLGNDLSCEVIHTPGHSRGSISLWLQGEQALISGDALPIPDDLPIYEDIAASVASIRKLQTIANPEILLSSWEAPIHGRQAVVKRIDVGLLYLRRIHEAVMKAKVQDQGDLMALCREVIGEIGLPPFAANPLVARGFASSLAAGKNHELFAE